MSRYPLPSTIFDEDGVTLWPLSDISALDFPEFYTALPGSTAEMPDQYTPGLDWTWPSNILRWDVEPLPFANCYQMQQQDQYNVTFESSSTRDMEAPQISSINNSGPDLSTALTAGTHQIEAQTHPSLRFDSALTSNTTKSTPARSEYQSPYYRRKQIRALKIAKRFEAIRNRPVGLSLAIPKDFAHLICRHREN